MRTAITEADRHYLEYHIQAWIAADLQKEQAVDAITAQLEIDTDRAIDLLNTCANSRAFLDGLGIEVYSESGWYGDVPPPMRSNETESTLLRVLSCVEWPRFWFALAMLVAIVALMLLVNGV